MTSALHVDDRPSVDRNGEATSSAPPYDPAAIEARWQAAWRDAGLFATARRGKPRRRTHLLVARTATSAHTDAAGIRTYTLADAHARFRRARGWALLFSPGLTASDLLEDAPPAGGDAARRWAAAHSKRLRTRLDRMGYSFDWSRTFVASEPELWRWTQWLFLVLLDAGAVHRTSHWYLRLDGRFQEMDRRLDELRGWSPGAAEAQRAALGRVDGVEVTAQTLDRRLLTVFTPHPDSIDGAAFVAISPSLPDMDRWISDPEVRARIEQVRARGWPRKRDGSDALALNTGLFVQAAGVDRLLPVVVSPTVEARFGHTAILAVPELDELDRRIAAGLKPPTMSWNLKPPKRANRPAVRYPTGDIRISRASQWGISVPVVHCSDCGIVPVGEDTLPVHALESAPLEQQPDPVQCSCPRCDRPAQRDTDTFDSHFDGVWRWLAPCIPPGNRAEAIFEHPQVPKWLPVNQAIGGTEGGRYVLAQRLIADVLRERGVLRHLRTGEPFGRMLVHGEVRKEGAGTSEQLGDLSNLDELLGRVGADTVRLTVLYAAAPANGFPWNDQALRYCHGFLQRVWRHAEPRLRELRHHEAERIDVSDRPRRRLATWCRVAIAKVTADLDALEMHRAVRNVMRFLTRIEDFEARVLETRPELDDRDREAQRIALLLLVQLLAPIAPHLAEELWAAAGKDTLVSATSWPSEGSTAWAPPG